MRNTVSILSCVLLLAAAVFAAPGGALTGVLIAPRGASPDRIVNGVDTDIKDVPYQVALLQYGQLFCGGSILNSRLILTAAHCTDGTNARLISVRAGSSYFNRGGQLVRVASKVEHRDYNAETTDYDVAVLKLASSIKLGPGAQSVPILGVGSQLSPNTDALVSGWGALYTDGPSPTHLQSVEVSLIPRSDCEAAYGPGAITSRMICFGLPQGGKDSCQGDSGGPLVTQDVLVGIVSWGGVCGAAGQPGVYTNVADPSISDLIQSAAA